MKTTYKTTLSKTNAVWGTIKSQNFILKFPWKLSGNSPPLLQTFVPPFYDYVWFLRHSILIKHVASLCEVPAAQRPQQRFRVSLPPKTK